MRTLNTEFDSPPIACHHDFSQSLLDESLFPGNVRFVHPHFVTGWGEISVSLAAIRAFALLRAHDLPEWFVLLSASDYPVRPADEIWEELKKSEYDVYLDHREIQYGPVSPEEPEETEQHSSFRRPDYIPLAYDRYFAFRLRLPCPSTKKLLSGRFPFRMTQTLVTRNPTFSRTMQWLHFRRPARIFAGDFWFQANQTAMNRLLDDPSVPTLARYYRARPLAEESFFHTILCNQAGLRISRDNKRYADWPVKKVKHPKLLDISDLPKIIASGAHFARKFSADGVTQTFIDRNVLKIQV